MKLIRFQDYLGQKAALGKPPATIRAKDLDQNFEALKIKDIRDGSNAVIGKATISEDGQTIKLEGWSITSLTVCEGGTSKTIKILARNA